MNFRWIGPHLTLRSIGNFVYKVANLDRASLEQIHAALLQLYRVSAENTPMSEQLMDLAERTESVYELIEKVKLGKP